MKIVVLDTAAEKGGALTVLKDYYNKAKIDIDNEYLFITGNIALDSAPNITCKRFPFSKRNWLCRLLFDYFYLPFFIAKQKCDKVLSLQNMIVPFVKKEQIVYLHNALPFSEYRFTWKQNKKMWIYQNLIGYLIRKSVEKAHVVIVQCEWMKEVLVEQLRVQGSKIMVQPYEVKMSDKIEKTKFEKTTFFYPASSEEFKNHKLIVEAVSKLVEKGYRNFEILFTIEKDENEYTERLYEMSSKGKCPICFGGHLTLNKVYSFYTDSILVFPSYIETVGLPLMEATVLKRPIIAADLKYAHSALKGNESVVFFNPFNSDELAEAMEKFLE